MKIVLITNPNAILINVFNVPKIQNVRIIMFVVRSMVFVE